MTEKRGKVLLLLTLLLSLSLRLFGQNWDANYHLHPDERAIIMFSENIKLPASFPELFTNQSPLNPKFFAYGSLPLYLLKGISSLLNMATYDGMLIVGRNLSALVDTLTVFIVFLIVREISNNRFAALLASFLYGISVLPIQTAHFFVVDTTLTFLSTLTLVLLIKFYKKPSINNSILVGIALGFALATKISIIILALPITITLLLSSLKQKSKLVFYKWSILTFAFCLFTFIIAMPYALIDRQLFISQVKEQLRMNSDPYTFPFTLQYVDTTPYWYYLKNIILWGLGPVQGLIALTATLFLTLRKKNSFSLFLLIFFFWLYFLILGRSAVKFMRYLLPLYPLFAIFSALLLGQTLLKVKKISPFLSIVTCYLLIVTLLAWPFSFLRIYTRLNTRVIATQWIHQNIPTGSTLALEHWDDGLPLNYGQNYTIVELPLYDDDTDVKWTQVTQKLAQTDYIIIASNRLYVPLTRLTNCQKYKRCYPITSQYYQHLFTNELGFTPVKIFSSYPQVPYLNLRINDDPADESFTVYDHPKIIIFKKTQQLNPTQLLNIIKQ